MTVPESFQCVDCDGVAHLLTKIAPDASPDPGSVLSYLCASCWERFDVVWEDQENDG